MSVQPKTTNSGDAATTMATIATSPTTTTGSPSAEAILNKLQGRSPVSTQLIAFFTLLIAGSILLFLAGLTLTATVLALLTLTPLILFTSPIWVPLASLFLLTAVVLVSSCGSAAAALAGGSWAYRHFRRQTFWDRANYVRGRMADHVRDSAKEPDRHPHGRAKGATPGA